LENHLSFCGLAKTNVNQNRYHAKTRFKQVSVTNVSDHFKRCLEHLYIKTYEVIKWSVNYLQTAVLTCKFIQHFELCHIAIVGVGGECADNSYINMR